MSESFDFLTSQQLLEITQNLKEKDKNEIKELLGGTQKKPELSISYRYDKSRRLNGCGIIFNFEKFKNQEKRHGSKEDVKRLSEIFKKLNIDLTDDRIHKNLPYNDMVTKINEFKANTSLLSNSNALIVVILSHGLEGDQIMTADGAFNLYNFIDKFTAENLPAMAGRPKIFLVQACRGGKLDSGVILKEENLPVVHKDSVKEEFSSRYPNYADICIAFSSFHGHVSYRNDNGSWFIQEFCNVLEEIDLTQNHLLDVLTITNARVAERKAPGNNKQISNHNSTFTKMFYF